MKEFFRIILPIQAAFQGEKTAIVTFVFIVITFSIFLGAFLWIIFKTYKTGKKFRLIIDKVKNEKRPALASIKHNLSEEFKKHNLSKEWQGFEESLVSRKDKNENEILYKTKESSLFFSEDDFINHNLHLRLINSIPALLVGVGILGTFFGLTFGLTPFSNVDFTKAEDIQNAIQKLLSGISTAFVTSLWGMLFSIIFTFIEKFPIRSLSKLIVELNRELDRLFTLTTQEEIEYRQEDELKQQTQALKSFSTDLADRIKIAMNEIMSYRLDALNNETRILQESMAKRSEQILSEIKNSAIHIANNVSQSVSNTLTEKLTPAIDDVSKAILELKKQKEESSEVAIRQLVSDFQKSLSGTAISELEGLARNVKQASNSLEELPNQVLAMIGKINLQINQACQLMEYTSKKVNEDAEKRSALIEKQLQQQLNNVDQVFEKLISAIKNQYQEVNEAIANNIHESAAVTKRMREEVESSTEALSENIRSLVEDISNLLEQQSLQTEQVNDFIENSKNLVKQIIECIKEVNSIISDASNLSQNLIAASERLDKSGESLQKTSLDFIKYSENQFKENFEMIQKIQESLYLAKNTLSDFSDKFDTIEKGLKNIFNEIESGLNNYAINIRDSINKYLGEFAQHLTETASALAGSIEGLNEIVDSLNDILGKITK